MTRHTRAPDTLGRMVQMTLRADCVIAASLIVCVVAVGCSRTVSGTPRVAGDSRSATAPNATQADLERLLLNDGQISTIMDVENMRTYRVYTGIPVQPREIYSDPDCAGTLFNTTTPAYEGIDYISARGKKIDVPGRGSIDEVDQAVVAFETASKASKFVSSSNQRWYSCSGKHMSYTGADGQVRRWTLGVPRKVDEIIAVTNVNAWGWQCGHAMATRSNVVADVDACGYDIKDQAIAIVKAIITVAQ
jgi:hypothetical protein